MAMYTLIEINGDHLSDLLGKGIDVGMALQTIVRNTFNAPRVLEETDLYRVLRVVKQSGERYNDKPYPNYSKDSDLSLRIPEGAVIVKDGNKPEDASAVKSDLSGRPKWEEIMNMTTLEVYNHLSNSNAQWLDVTTALQKQIDTQNKTVATMARQIEQLHTRIEDLEDENAVEDVARSVKVLEKRMYEAETISSNDNVRIAALEAWRKS